MRYVVNLNETGKSDIELVGGKGANLGEMLQAEFPVPRAFCVTSNGYDDFIDQNKFQEVIDEYLKKIYEQENNGYNLACELMDIISEGKISKFIEDEILSFYRSFGDNVRVAVRSSATAEDLPGASFAGQQETYLNVQGEEALLKKIKQCFASLWTERAISYRRENGFDKEKVHLAVVVQEMIEGDISGVLFTVNPTNKNKNEMMINSSYGLGEAIVSGKVTPDTIIWKRDDREAGNMILGSKEISIVYDNKGEGIIEIENSQDKRDVFSITEEQISKLVKVAENIENHYGHPQDIEWAIKNNNVYILQAREITTLKNDNNKNEQKTEIKKLTPMVKKVMDNLIEHYPEPLYPLEFEPLSIVMSGKIKVFNELGITMKNQVEMSENGLLTINESSTKISPKILALPFKIKKFISYCENTSNTDKVFQSVNNKLLNIENELKINNKEYSYLENHTVNEILNIFKEIMEITKDLIYVRFRYNIFPSVLVSKFTRSKLNKVKEGMTEYDTLSDLNYKTIEMNKSLEGLAEIIKSDNSLYKDIINLKGLNKDKLDEKLDIICRSNLKFEKAYKELLNKFGWKSLNGYQAFTTVSWNEDKSKLLTMLYIYLSGNKEKQNKNKYKEICETIHKKFSKKGSEKLISKIEQIRTYHVNREESLYMMERCYGILRNILKQITNEYQNIFKSEKDILYLTVDELYRLSYEIDEEALIKSIKNRKESRKENELLWYSVDLGTVSDGKYDLKGTSGNQGKYKGRVCIVKDVSEFEKIKEGDVLVCKCTDPSWTPLFTLAKAVVSDTGGPLSHSAIVAREYNIPAVLGCGNATKVLNDGDEVLVDGDEGKVLIKERSETI